MSSEIFQPRGLEESWTHLASQAPVMLAEVHVSLWPPPPTSVTVNFMSVALLTSLHVGSRQRSAQNNGKREAV